MALPDAIDRRVAHPAVPVVVAGVLVAATYIASSRNVAVNDVVRGAVAALPLVLIGVLTLPVLVAIALRPQRGLLILAALVPFNGLLIIAPGKPAFAEGWKEALALYTLLWAVLGRVGKPRVRHPFPKLVQPLFTYLALGALSAAVVGGVQGLVGVKVGFFWVLAGLTAWLAPFDARDRDRLVSVLMIAGLLTSLYGLAQQRIGAAGLVDLGYAYNDNVRFTGSFVRSFSSFPNPFNFAFFLTFVVLIALPVCIEDPKRTRNTLFLAGLPIIGLALVFTFVRGAWIALAVGSIYLAVRRYRVLLLPVPLVLVAMLLVPGSFSASAFQGESFGERQIGWSQNLSKVVSAPLGNGIGTTGASAAKAVEVRRDKLAIVYQPDNQYFKVLYELGVIGLWLFGFTLASVLFASRRAERALTRAEQPLALGFSAHVLGAIVASIVATWMEIFPNDLFLWLMLAVVVTATHESS